VSGPSLAKEARALVRELELLEVLTRFGRAEVVGSVAQGLVVRRDVDVHLLTRGPSLPAVCDAVACALVSAGIAEDVRFTDYRERGGMKLELLRRGATGEWKLDVWITQRPECAGFDDVRELAARLTPEHRETIPALKRHYHARGRLVDGLSSRICRAVLDRGITTPEAFETWLSCTS